ncbi:DUF397 domain-containing protein [Actinomadura sp. NPDC049382]|uniref:DUF397 domain-containing protein n=1 Tax=Actinomadura sp. NPDC049382 TaxID=3158220 RepID=UPI0034393974
MILVWRKSSYSGGADDAACVEAAAVRGGVEIRDSKNPNGEHLSMTGAVFAGLVRQVKDGTFDRP